jgi:hypothetical protein
MKYVIIGLVVLLVLWLLIAIIRAMSGAGRPSDGKGGGGGFFPSLLGGLFGASAGMWLYDNFFSGQSTAGGRPSAPPFGHGGDKEDVKGGYPDKEPAKTADYKGAAAEPAHGFGGKEEAKGGSYDKEPAKAFDKPGDNFKGGADKWGGAAEVPSGKAAPSPTGVGEESGSTQEDDDRHTSHETAEGRTEDDGQGARAEGNEEEGRAEESSQERTEEPSPEQEQPAYGHSGDEGRSEESESS